MKATDILKEEHKGILLMLAILEAVCRRLKAGEKVAAAHLEQIVEFIQVFADQCHHGKEEGLLFPAMEKSGIPKEGGPLGIMLREHSVGRSYVKNLAGAIEDYKKGDANAPSRIIDSAKNYIALLTQHITKEDNILYDIADERLSENIQKELVTQFARIEEKKIGPGRHEEFHKLLHTLKGIYLA